MSLKVLGWTFFGNTFFETRAYGICYLLILCNFYVGGGGGAILQMSKLHSKVSQEHAPHFLVPWTKKKGTIREICGEKNAVPSSDILLDDARSAQGKTVAG